MDYGALLAGIRAQEQRNNGAFTVLEVCYLADSMLATRDSEGEFAVYYDREIYILDTVMDDTGPAEVGMFFDVMSSSWEDILEAAQFLLQRQDGQDIIWSAELEALPFPRSV